ncbi:transporter substrate-binding domain-containing protein [Specibacter sp. RAF43]|uniref:transporter substrate-binding domain-containing protein n=1 Tax=Specibacter sp. RAF43 TaxID=3233057 RepID=UPI003F9E44C2
MSRKYLLSALAVATLVAVSACGSPAGSGTSDQPTALAPSAAALLPANIKSAGAVRIGASYQTAPMTMLLNDGQDKSGISHELATLAVEQLGLKGEFTTMPFPGQAAALEADKIDAVWETTSINAERLKSATFVEFAKLTYGVLVPRGNPANITDLKSFCGLRIGVPQGSIFQDYVESASSDCKAAGSAPVNVLTYKGPPEGRLAVLSKNADAFLGGYANNLYYAEHSDKGAVFSAVEVPDIKATPIGIQFKKGNTELAKAMAEAVNALIADGSYKKVFKKYGLEAMEINSASIVQ